MRRRSFLKKAGFAAAGLVLLSNKPQTSKAAALDPGLASDWLARWKKHILDEERNRYCDRELGEEIGWLISPFLNAFYYGYQATRDPKWAGHLADWADRGSGAG